MIMIVETEWQPCGVVRKNVLLVFLRSFAIVKVDIKSITDIYIVHFLIKKKEETFFFLHALSLSLFLILQLLRKKKKEKNIILKEKRNAEVSCWYINNLTMIESRDEISNKILSR